MRFLPLLPALLFALQPLAAQAPGAIRGRVLLASAQPAPGAQVSVRGSTVHRTTADSTGHFLIAAVPAGPHILVASLEGHNPGTALAVVRATDTISVEVTLGGPVELTELTVSATQPYLVPEAATATRMDTPIMATPLTVSVVPQAVLADQQVTRLEKALQNVAGVRRVAFNQNLTDQFILRGFFSNTTYRDGYRYDARNGSHRDLANVERVEVLKGPGSILYGRAEPGGIINLVTKRAEAAPSLGIQQQAGAWSSYRTTADATGPLGAGGRLLYRVNVAYENNRSFRDFEKSHRLFVAPQVSWAASRRVRTTVELEYLRDRATPLPRLPEYYGNRAVGGIADVPRSLNLGEPFSRYDTRTVIGGLRTEVSLTPGWRLVHRANLTHEHADAFNVYIMGPADPDYIDETIFQRGYQDFVNNTTALYQGLDLAGRAGAFGLEHSLLVGADFLSDHTHFPRFFDENTGDSTLNIDIHHPVYLPGPIRRDRSSDRSRSNGTWWFGAYAQDQVQLPSDFHLLAGLRFDVARSESDNATTERDHRLSPRLGLLWRPRPALSTYFSYTENFGASNGLDDEDKPLPVQTAEQFEAGIKLELAGGRVRTSVAAFDLAKHNLPGEDRNGNTIIIDEAHNRGIEAELAGEPAAGWRVVIGYAWIPYARWGGGINLGNRMWGVPRHTLNVWTTTRLPAGFHAGAGVIGATEIFNDLENSIRLPGYVVVNAMAGYDFAVGGTSLGLQLNGENLLDRTYYNFGTQFGLPRSFTLSATARF